METDQTENKALNEKVKSLQETIDLQLELIEQLQDENIKLQKEKERLKKGIAK